MLKQQWRCCRASSQQQQQHPDLQVSNTYVCASAACAFAGVLGEAAGVATVLG
jgi:hypothetical protein